MNRLTNSEKEKLSFFCEKWKIVELSIFGSFVTENYNSQSDVDILIDFTKDNTYTLFDFLDMKEELEMIFLKRVDLLTKNSLIDSNNQRLIKNIFSTKEKVYVK